MQSGLAMLVACGGGGGGGAVAPSEQPGSGCSVVGKGPPPGDLAQAGCYYVDEANDWVYRQDDNGQWLLLQGPGGRILSGPDAPPPDDLGLDGDFYVSIDAQNDNRLWFGPKVDGSWPALGISIVGPAGPQGPQGDSGPPGTPGKDGQDGLARYGVQYLWNIAQPFNWMFASTRYLMMWGYGSPNYEAMIPAYLPFDCRRVLFQVGTLGSVPPGKKIMLSVVRMTPEEQINDRVSLAPDSPMQCTITNENTRCDVLSTMLDWRKRDALFLRMRTLEGLDNMSSTLNSVTATVYCEQ